MENPGWQLVSCARNSQIKSPDAGEDVIDGLRPRKRRGCDLPLRKASLYTKNDENVDLERLHSRPDRLCGGLCRARVGRSCQDADGEDRPVGQHELPSPFPTWRWKAVSSKASILASSVLLCCTTHWFATTLALGFRVMTPRITSASRKPTFMLASRSCSMYLS